MWADFTRNGELEFKLCYMTAIDRNYTKPESHGRFNFSFLNSFQLTEFLSSLIDVVSKS